MHAFPPLSGMKLFAPNEAYYCSLMHAADQHSLKPLLMVVRQTTQMYTPFGINALRAPEFVRAHHGQHPA